MNHEHWCDRKCDCGANPEREDSLEKDAARYRWLKTMHDGGDEQWFVYGAHDDLDKSVDEAMNETHR